MTSALALNLFDSLPDDELAAVVKNISRALGLDEKPSKTNLTKLFDSRSSFIRRMSHLYSKLQVVASRQFSTTSLASDPWLFNRSSDIFRSSDCDQLVLSRSELLEFNLLERMGGAFTEIRLEWAWNAVVCDQVFPKLLRFCSSLKSLKVLTT